jgi:HK97 gp10 family phage protein
MPTVARVSDTKVKAIIEGGPELAAKLNALDAKIRKQVAKDALMSGGRVIADKWADMVPIGSPPHDPHPGAYQRAMRDEAAVKTRASANGASGSVRPAALSDLPDDQQPRAYAGVLEFGDADQEAQPSARPAFEAALPAALAAVSKSLAEALK